jgi:hypothetical protein
MTYILYLEKQVYVFVEHMSQAVGCTTIFKIKVFYLVPVLHYEFNCCVLTLCLRTIYMLFYLSLLTAFDVYFRML